MNSTDVSVSLAKYLTCANMGPLRLPADLYLEGLHLLIMLTFMTKFSFTLIQVLPHSGFCQRQDAGTSHCLLGDLQHLPARVAVRNTLV